MGTDELEIMASEVLRDFEGGELEPHEIQARVRQLLDQMRAFGMPLPDDLVRLEQELGDTFDAESQES